MRQGLQQCGAVAVQNPTDIVTHKTHFLVKRLKIDRKRQYLHTICSYKITEEC